MQLSLTLTFLFNRYHGRDESGQTLEWPPSPLRLYQALIAASHRGVYGTMNQTERDRALRWLATLEPPVIETANFIEAGRGVTNYLPNNDNQIDHIRSAVKPMLAQVMPKDACITYRWQVEDGAEARTNARTLCAMAELVTHLGRHEDMVFAQGHLTEIPPPIGRGRITHKPQLIKNGHWKVPTSGTLEALQLRYDGVLNGESPLDYPIPSLNIEYRLEGAISGAALLALFELRRPKPDESWMPFELRDLRQPSGMVRNALLDWLKANKGFRQHYGEDMTARLLGGHEPGRPDQPYDGAHIAFVPIPTLRESGPSDGLIRRVLVIGFGCETGLARDMFDDAVGNLNSHSLRDNGRHIGFLRRTSEQEDRVLGVFIKKQTPCRVWRTVTPIIFTGLMRRGRGVEAMIMRALKQSGIDESDIHSVAAFDGPIVPKAVHTRLASKEELRKLAFNGTNAPQTIHALDYRVQGYLAQTPRYHAEVIFKRPVIGPLVIGRGRHSGFGLMLPCLEEIPEQLK